MERVWEFSGFRFEVGPDPADGRRLRVLAFRDGEPFCDLHGEQFAKGFAPGASPERVEAFCRRFAEDSAYRTQLLVKHAFACC
jgi:hypothetical protein